MPTAPAPEWLDDISFDAARPWLEMGTKSLGDRPWLIVDDQRATELAEKHRLLTERHNDVFAVVGDLDDSDVRNASAELLTLVQHELAAMGVETPPSPFGLHPLDEAGRLVQEDLCLLRRRPADGAEGPQRWCLDAASLCFPSRWRLADKLGHPMGAVHGPVDGYDPVLIDRVDRLLDALVDGPPGRVVRRRNWFVHPDASLFQPTRPANEEVIPADRADDELIVRSERQTLRALPSGWIVFTIRIQQATLGVALTDPVKREAFTRSLAEASPADLAHRGLSAEQVAALR